MHNDSLLSLLRAGTQDNHQQLEAHPMLRPLVHGELSQRHYTQVLQAFLLLYQNMEPWLLDSVGTQHFPARAGARHHQYRRGGVAARR